jgi:hypothetical protein
VLDEEVDQRATPGFRRFKRPAGPPVPTPGAEDDADEDSTPASDAGPAGPPVTAARGAREVTLPGQARSTGREADAGLAPPPSEGALPAVLLGAPPLWPLAAAWLVVRIVERMMASVAAIVLVALAVVLAATLATWRR